MDTTVRVPEVYRDNRQRFIDKLNDDSVCVIFSGMPYRKSADALYPFFADRNFFYLTGIEQEGSALVILKKAGKVLRLTLCIRTADKNSERWNGVLLSERLASAISGIYDIAHSECLDAIIRDVLTDFSGIMYLDLNCSVTSNVWLSNILEKEHPHILRSDLQSIFSGLRAIKSDHEIEMMRKAIEITGKGIEAIYRNIKPGMREYQAAAIFQYVLAMNGAGEPSFDTIVAAGSNFNYLHYPQLSDVISDGDMVLLDVGVRWNGLCSDISRAFPVSGKFSEKQLAVYNAVRNCQEAAFEFIRPGVLIKEVNNLCRKTAADELIALGVIDVPDKIVNYYWHNVSHHLGLDVHDIVSRECVLEAGMVITVEPGIYIPEWNTGLRIEDDVLVTEDGCEILSAEIPREAREIEELIYG
ncbi:MAG: Xaa-Pro peptidase family protein [Saccharofermentanales bacterium]